MDESLTTRFEITRREVVKDKALKTGAWVSPIMFSLIPAVVFLILSFVFGAVPFIFFSLISLAAGFVIGLIVSGILMFYRQKWLAQIREQIAVDGIKTEEVRWFQHELKTAEKKSLKELESQNRLLADAYRETLASRLTATRIIKKSKEEALLVKKRQNKLKYLKTDSSAELQKNLEDDYRKFAEIQSESQQMLSEAETRLQMIEAAARRGVNLADTELALKKLTARAEQLPLALEALQAEEELRKEIDQTLSLPETDKAEK